MHALFLIALAAFAQSPQYDLLIRNGAVIDGTGKPRFRADVGVRGDRIVFVGDARAASARTVIDALGLAVAPGFIDVHNHSEGDIADPKRRLNEGFVRQGVTTVVGGPDGSLAPARMRRLIDAYAANGIGTNVALYAGHNAIRLEVMKADQKRAPTAEELGRMRALVREGMEMGALGFSTGLMYEPGMFSATGEVVALAREVKPFHGIYDSHVRNPAHQLLESDREVITVAERAGIPGKIAHEKAVGLEHAGLIKEVIALVESSRARGLNIVTDQYPYDGAATSTLDDIIVMPPELNVELKAMLRDPALRRRARQTSENGVNGGFAWLKATGYSHMRITASADFPELVGRYLSELATERRMAGFDLVSDLILRAKDPVYVTLGAVKEQDVRDLLVRPWNMIASDGGWADGGPGSEGHPRSTGTFPRVLGHYARDVKLLTLEEAVRKMTSLPAEFMGLLDRGGIAVGKAADIAVFDPKTIRDRSTYVQPSLYAEGVVHVVVNGVAVLRDGKLTGQSPGKFLRRGLGPTKNNPLQAN